MNHIIDSDKCWCKPRCLQVCRECIEDKYPRKGCWLCAGFGFVDVYNEDLSMIIEHKGYPTKGKRLAMLLARHDWIVDNKQQLLGE